MSEEPEKLSEKTPEEPEGAGATKQSPAMKIPKDWERLFVVSDDNKSVSLRFLPDTKKYKADTLLLIIYGYKFILGIDRVPVGSAHHNVNKTIDSAPNRPSRPFSSILGPIPAAFFSEEDYVSEYLGSGFQRVALSKGGMYELTEYGVTLASSLAYDLISRAD